MEELIKKLIENVNNLHSDIHEIKKSLIETQKTVNLLDVKVCF